MMEHPSIVKTMRTGYPHAVVKPCGDDFFGNEYYPGDVILVLDDEVFLKDAISYDLQEYLLQQGAEEKTA